MNRNVMNDQEIIALYWAKEERAISATAEKYGNYCHIIAYNILYDYFDAEECVNDTFCARGTVFPLKGRTDWMRFSEKSLATSL